MINQTQNLKYKSQQNFFTYLALVLDLSPMIGCVMYFKPPTALEFWNVELLVVHSLELVDATLAGADGGRKGAILWGLGWRHSPGLSKCFHVIHVYHLPPNTVQWASSAWSSHRNDRTAGIWCCCVRVAWCSRACCCSCCSCSALAKLRGWGHRSAPWIKAGLRACPVSGCTSGGCISACGATICLGLLTFVLDLANSNRMVWGRSGSNRTPCCRSCLAASAPALELKVTNPTGLAVFPFLLVTLRREPS